jgi:hypothetical protein
LQVFIEILGAPIVQKEAMKKKWMILVSLAFIGCCMAEDYEFRFLPSHGMIASGKVIGYREDGRDQWIINVTDIKIFYFNSDSDIKSGSKIQIPDKIAVKATSSWVRPTLPSEPDKSWIGRIAIFSGEYSDGCLTVKVFISSGISCFDLHDEPENNSFEYAANLFKLTDPAVRLQKVKDIIENPKTPLFVTTFCMEQIVYSAGTKLSLDPDLRIQLIKWRDIEILDPEVRFRADAILQMNANPGYDFSEDRFAFLNKLKDNPKISKGFRMGLEIRLKDAQELKAIIEKKKQ